MHRELNQDFFKSWSPDMAYVLGYFAADGSMAQNTRGAHFMEFASTDSILIRHVRKVTGSSHSVTIRDRGGTNWKTQYRLQIGSKEWFTDLSRLGFTQAKSNTLQFPIIPKAYTGDFVRGYFDGDGCVYLGEHYSKWHKKRVWVFTTRFTSGSKQFLDDLQRELKAFGLVGGYVTHKNRGFELVFSRHDSVALYQLMYHTGLDSDLFLPRKRTKLERAIRVLRLRG